MTNCMVSNLVRDLIRSTQEKFFWWQKTHIGIVPAISNTAHMTLNVTIYFPASPSLCLFLKCSSNFDSLNSNYSRVLLCSILLCNTSEIVLDTVVITLPFCRHIAKKYLMKNIFTWGGVSSFFINCFQNIWRKNNIRSFNQNICSHHSTCLESIIMATPPRWWSMKHNPPI